MIGNNLKRRQGKKCCRSHCGYYSLLHTHFMALITELLSSDLRVNIVLISYLHILLISNNSHYQSDSYTQGKKTTCGEIILFLCLAC